MPASGRAAGEAPADPVVDGAEGKAGPALHAAVLEHPLPLRRREVAVEDEPGSLPHEGQVARLLQFLAPLGGAAVLPDDRPVQGLAALQVPGDGGLALVGDPDRSYRRLDRRRRAANPGAELGERRLDEAPDLRRVVLDEARAGKVLRELPVGDLDDLTGLADGERPHAGGAGVDGDDHGRGWGHGWRVAMARTATGEQVFDYAAALWGGFGHREGPLRVRPGANLREHPLTCTAAAPLPLTRPVVTVL